MYSISRLGRQFKLSRSTLLYYDKIGLLSPSGRTDSNYRIYSESDRVRLEQICMYRKMGLSLRAIGKVLDSKGDKTLIGILNRRLKELGEEIDVLRYQQQVIVSILKSNPTSATGDKLNKEKWVALLRASGLDDAGMQQWHVEFEMRHPEDHQRFLESLGIPKREIEQIRKRSIDQLATDR